jgi:hypothetical protein
MQKITVVGKDSAAKKAAVTALKSSFKVTNLRPEQVGIKDMNSASLVIYFNEESSQQNIERPNLNPYSVNLQPQFRRPKLNSLQRKVFLRLAKGSSDEDNWTSLQICRTRYFIILEQLRGVFDVEKNWELIQLAKDKAI